MIKRYSHVAYICENCYSEMEYADKGEFVSYQDFQALVQLMKEYIVCNECALYDSSADQDKDEAILNKIEQFLGKGWDK